MKTTKLHMDLRQGQVLLIGDSRIVLEHKSGQAARLCIEAPRDVKITRQPTETTSAQECASSPSTGKEQSHGQYPV